MPVMPLRAGAGSLAIATNHVGIFRPALHITGPLAKIKQEKL
jgi:hypothetical protein